MLTWVDDTLRQSAAPDKEVVTSGWVGRYFDNACSGSDPKVGVSIGETSPLAMRGDRITALAFERAADYQYNGRDKNRYLTLNQPTNNTTISPDIAPTSPIIKPAAAPMYPSTDHPTRPGTRPGAKG